MKQKILAWCGAVMMAAFGLTMLQPRTVSALGGGDCGASTFLGMRPWYAGLCNEVTNEIQEPDDDADTVAFIWTIILNVLFDILVAVGYLGLIFIIYGGYLYMTSQGNAGKVEKGKMTLTAAVIGTIIAMSASVVVNTARVILGINTTDGWQQPDFTKTQMENVFSWAYTIAGLVAVIFIIKGGVSYLTSQGDSGKTKTATQTILYAVVGLVVVILAALITNFVISSTGGALK